MANHMLPGNPRYQPKQLVPFFGYDNLFRTVAEVEFAAMEVLRDIGFIPEADWALLTPGMRDQIMDIPTTNVDKVEREVTKHDIRAWVRLAQGILPPELARWVHVPLTSYDPLDTGRTLQYMRAWEYGLKPGLIEVLQLLVKFVRRFSDTVQIGRTHGQHALPITVGFWMALILYRVWYNANEVSRNAQRLVGKISGAVGAYNAQVGLGIEDRCGDQTFEERMLDKLGLRPSPISSQVLPPEPLGYFLFSVFELSAAFGQFGLDGRNLMRTEIAEVVEGYEEGQVGSSTLAHKRNPINWENLQGTHLKNIGEFVKVLVAQNTEHQRDLVASCVMRDWPTLLVNVQNQLNTLLRKDKNGVPFLARLRVDEEACQRNLGLSGQVILAEPLYIALQMAGYNGDAHKLVNERIIPTVKRLGWRFGDVVAQIVFDGKDAALTEAWNNVPMKIKSLFDVPQAYTGKAFKKAIEIADLVESGLATL